MDSHPLDIALEHCKQGDFDKSLKILEDVFIDGQKAYYNLGWHFMRRGQFKKGMECLAHGRFGNVFGLRPIKTDKPIWQGEGLQGKTILLRGEGGYGDEIINVRFARNFKDKGARVIVSCQESLKPLFKIQPYIDSVINDNEIANTYFDYWVPAMSAPLVLGMEYQDLSGDPYISGINAVLKRKKGYPRIGLKWSGNPEFEQEQFRKFPPDLMINLSQRFPKLNFYSFQRDNDLIDLPFDIFDLQNSMKDWLATAEHIKSMDLVITSCTSIAHLAASMGVPTWVVVPVMSYYVWALPGDASPWYNSIRIYRQERFGCWDAPFKKIQEDLNAVVL